VLSIIKEKNITEHVLSGIPILDYFLKNAALKENKFSTGKCIIKEIKFIISVTNLTQ
jgi:hypothetical protein